MAWIFSIAAGLFAGAASAAMITGPGVHCVDAAGDLAWTDAVPGNGVRTVRPGIFYPTDAQGNGPKNVETVVFRNVRLSDIESFSAKFGVNLAKDGDNNRKCSAYRWEDALVVTNNATAESINVQFHHRRLTSSLGTKAQFLFRQKGDDVAATLESFTYFYIQDGQIPGESWIYGVNLTNLVDSLYAVGDQSKVEESGHCVGYLGCALKAECGRQTLPDEIVFRSTAGAPAPVTVTYAPYLSNDFVVIAKNLYATNLTAASATLTGGEVKGEYLRAASCLTNDTTRLEKVFIIQRMAGTRRVGATVRVAQSNEYVLAKIEQAYHQYDGNTKTENDPLGNYFYVAPGGKLDTVTEPNGSGVALRGLTFTFAGEDALVSSSTAPLSHRHQLVWPGVRLSEVEIGPALMGGATTGGIWRRTHGWFTTDLVEGAVRQTYYQWSNGHNVWTLRTEFQQQEDGVYASVVSLRYNSTTQPPPYWDANLSGNYQTTLTNTVDGEAATGWWALALSEVTAARRRHAVHTVTLADGAQTGEVPVRLVDMDLALAPADGATATMPKSVSGDGRVVVSAGTTLVDSDRTLAVPVAVSPGATLAFAVSDGGVATLTAPEVVLADGAHLALHADARIAGMTATEAKSFALPAPVGAAAGMKIALLGAGFADCKVRGVTVADGLLTVSVARKVGGIVILR